MVNYSEFIEIVCSNLKITKPIVEEVLFFAYSNTTSRVCSCG